MARPIKITYMIDVLDTDLAGTEGQLIKMINGLDRNKFQVRLICLSNHPWFEANSASIECASIIFEIRQFKKLRAYFNFLKLVGFLRRDRPDIVHTFFPVSNIVGVLAARLAGVKNIISSRRDYGEWMTGYYLFATRIADKFARMITVNSTMVKELTLQKENVGNKKVEVIYNGIDADLFKDIGKNHALKKQLNIPSTHKVIGIVANFRPMKHHDTFIKAAREILTHRSDVTFLLIGAGPLKEDIQKLGGTLNILPHLCFAGAQNNIIPYLSIMDLGVNCSEAEGLSNAVMEYMAAGVPCVVSHSGGNPDLITNDFNGYSFTLDDYQALSVLILKLLDDEKTKQIFTKNARDKIRNEMSLDVMLSTYQNLYQRLSSG